MIRSWMVIGAITFLVALGSGVLRPKDIKWFMRQRRPEWLTFEPAIPLIWTIIFICGAWSAYIVWESRPGTSDTWLLMGLYLLLEIIIVAFSPVTLWLRSLKAGAYVGGAGFILGLILTGLVLSISGWAALLLVPYLIWSPIGTYTAWEMSRLNMESA
ncbi:MAG: tryptophan-rich sensory protein [Leptolyngbyaceae cyanobacterium bins.59]|nr:tryptophan-rich sensory protein [Leptolyngbyaceae cyanobacterium bins.59]